MVDDTLESEQKEKKIPVFPDIHAATRTAMTSVNSIGVDYNQNGAVEQQYFQGYPLTDFFNVDVKKAIIIVCSEYD